MLGSLFSALGLEPNTLPAVIGVVSEADFDTGTRIRTWQIVTALDGDGNPTARRAPTLAEQGKARFFVRICRLKIGVDHSHASTTSRKIKLSQVLSQVDDTEVDVISEADIVTMYGRCEVLFGKGQRPPNNRDPSAEQLAAVKSLLDTNQVPYTDFAVWGPFGSRIRKKLKYQGLTMNKEETELFGPPNLQIWKASYQVFSNCMIMWDGADLGPLIQYQERIERQHDRYGERTWALLYQADVRCRLEEWPPVRMELKRVHTNATAAGGTTAYDVNRPWNEALRQIAERDRFWTDGFVTNREAASTGCR